jgi:hypothetical protein
MWREGEGKPEHQRMHRFYGLSEADLQHFACKTRVGGTWAIRWNC